MCITDLFLYNNYGKIFKIVSLLGSKTEEDNLSLMVNYDHILRILFEINYDLSYLRTDK